MAEAATQKQHSASDDLFKLGIIQGHMAANDNLRHLIAAAAPKWRTQTAATILRELQLFLDEAEIWISSMISTGQGDERSDGQTV